MGDRTARLERLQPHLILKCSATPGLESVFISFR